MSGKYEQIQDGETFLIETDQELHLACCDCGLTHAFTFQKVRKGVKITTKRADRITAQIRRHKR